MMSTQNFKVGDVVILKSGSPEMTVTDIEENVISVIYWVPADNEFKTYNFLVGILIKIDKDKRQLTNSL
jgi:hypothetical protein